MISATTEDGTPTVRDGVAGELVPRRMLTGGARASLTGVPNPYIPLLATLGSTRMQQDVSQTPIPSNREEDDERDPVISAIYDRSFHKSVFFDDSPDDTGALEEERWMEIAERKDGFCRANNLWWSALSPSEVNEVVVKEFPTLFQIALMEDPANFQRAFGPRAR